MSIYRARLRNTTLPYLKNKFCDVWHVSFNTAADLWCCGGIVVAKMRIMHLETLASTAVVKCWCFCSCWFVAFFTQMPKVCEQCGCYTVLLITSNEVVPLASVCWFVYWQDYTYHGPHVGPGYPSSPLVHLFPLFTFPFLSLALPIFFFCPSLPFLPE